MQAGGISSEPRRLPPRRGQRVPRRVLLAAKSASPSCPHAVGVGLCEYVQHLSMWDYVACSASMEIG